ncbi:GNAT family N-acetyltransferase [Cobetia marina]|uniref:GNAT family N-acetyltransferase n=1 Tax=Cobetia marina TaxID=28258 RepID=UPI0025479420|nr:GNAT family N-acetyltransferase [Cobetia pacifica]MDI6002392.1 GNAT family N-acetyltransferase [Cobetia pacifica]
MKIRLATPKDALGISRVASALGYLPHDDDALILQRLEHLLASRHDRIWVAEQAGEVIGWLHAQHVFRVASADFIEILGLSVAREAQRQGAGRALARQAITWATDEALTLRVRTHEARDIARKFYAASGFTLAKTQCVFQMTT